MHGNIFVLRKENELETTLHSRFDEDDFRRKIGGSIDCVTRLDEWSLEEALVDLFDLDSPKVIRRRIEDQPVFGIPTEQITQLSKSLLQEYRKTVEEARKLLNASDPDATAVCELLQSRFEPYFEMDRLYKSYELSKFKLLQEDYIYITEVYDFHY
jgi:hypothetical protein